MAEFLPVAALVIGVGAVVGVWFWITRKDRSLDQTPYGGTTGWEKK
jgi:hypothetical protein